MRPRNVIAIVGLAGSGKTTAAHYLELTLGIPSLAYADPIKDMLAALGVAREELNDPLLKLQPLSWPLYPLTPRKMMQTLGTGWGQKLRKDLWVQLLHQRMEEIWTPKHPGSLGPPAVQVTDVRFDHEIEALRNSDTIDRLVVIHLRRPEQYTPWERFKRLFAHKSERGLKVEKDDVVIHNDGSISDLQGTVEQLVRQRLSIPYD